MSAPLPRRVWARAAIRAAALGVTLALLLLLVAGLSGAGLGGFDLLFAGLLGLVAGPLVLVERQAEGRRPGRRAGAALGCAALAGLWFVVCWAQLSYLSSLLRLGSLAGAHEAVLPLTLRLLELSAETRAVLFAFAPAFGLVSWLRLAGWGLPAQAGIALAGAQVISLLALTGFQGFPQVRWLIGSGWCSPAVGTFLFVLPVALPLALPALDHTLDGWQARGATGPEAEAAGAW